MAKRANTKKQDEAPMGYDALLAVVDCQFLDSYGTPVKHGSKIIIEANYNYQHFNNREALVEWYPEKGMYRFMFTNDHRFKSRHDFWGIHRFRVVQ